MKLNKRLFSLKEVMVTSINEKGIHSQLSRFSTAWGSCTGLVTFGPTKV